MPLNHLRSVAAQFTGVQRSAVSRRHFSSYRDAQREAQRAAEDAAFEKVDRRSRNLLRLCAGGQVVWLVYAIAGRWKEFKKAKIAEKLDAEKQLAKDLK